MGRKRYLSRKKYLYMKNDLSRLVNVMDELALRDEVHGIIGAVYPGFDFKRLDKTYANIINLYNGMHSGYLKSDNPYHDLEHTMMVFLAKARLLHGYQTVHGDDPENSISAEGALMGLEGALFHESGMVLSIDERGGTGAKFRDTHEKRGIEFTREYKKKHDNIYGNERSEEKAGAERELKFLTNVLRGTDLDQKPDDIRFSTYEEEVVSKMLGTADLLGQMSDPNYIFKLPYLYLEFIEAGITGFEGPVELIAKHGEFHDEMFRRMDNDLGGMRRHMRIHFREYMDMDRDLYQECIAKNLKRSKRIGRDPEKFLKRLWRNEDYNARLSYLTRLEEDTKQDEEAL